MELRAELEKAGLVEHEKEGLTHRYRPSVSHREATGGLLSDFLARFFHGSAEQLILGLVDAEKLAPDDLRTIEERLARARLEESSPARRDAESPPGPRLGRKKR